MYRCEDCNRKFEKPKKVVETHGQTTPPYEVFYLCPFCNSTSFKKIEVSYCKCCGRRLNNSTAVYCSETCRVTAIKLKQKEEKRKQENLKNPLNILIKEVEAYNTKHNTNYSYGQYVTLIKPKLLENKND